ncbi:putative NAD(P)H dehydrogenase [Rubellimicrobium mesophilum DSM 19309]|uniref:Putative NAD(P)H dehydrogenase n=1 Tax=Rubellimicrobium mesophilum DSM 19309 TaxID=442562 RepID=A0A017HLB2_9RHOB|nr:NAD(P)H-dependent oxidoreductase [Rubellimicrobium mesophilum]EYD75141.1 putative NAD(P)H dehydrogenase [Rubellimicrobium mesophilum DSM 19309]
MRLLVVHAHPVPESFGTALFRAVTEAAAGAGHEVRAIDLHAEGFDPRLSAEERRSYNDAPPPDPALLDPTLGPHLEALRWAEGIVLVHPTWWMAPPAMLKGWLDRVWRPGVAFHADPGGGAIRPGLPQVRLLGVVTTLGSPWWAWTFLIGAPGRRMLLRGLRPCVARDARTFWLARHDMDRSTEAQRERFLAVVRRRIARIPV